MCTKTNLSVWLSSQEGSEKNHAGFSFQFIYLNGNEWSCIVGI